MGVLGAKFVKTKVTDTFTSVTTKNVRSIVVLVVMINVWFMYWIARHVVNTIHVKLPTILEVGETIINLKLEKLWVVTWKMLSKSFYRVTFYNQITKIFLKTWKLDWSIKQGSDPTKWEFTGLELSKLCLLMVWILRVTISNVYVFTSTLGLVNRCWELIHSELLQHFSYWCFWSHLFRTRFLDIPQILTI